MASVTTSAARRPRSYVRVQGPDAADYLDRMLTNVVPESGSVDALLLTPKARVVAPLLVWRRGDDDFLLLTEPELGEVVRTQLLRARFAAKCEIELEEHTSTVVLGGGDGIPNRDYGVEIDDRVLPAEAGLDERAISFTKGCFPGQEPVARQHHRGKVNRRLRVLDVDGDPPAPETPVTLDGKDVGRVTSAVRGVALAY